VREEDLWHYAEAFFSIAAGSSGEEVLGHGVEAFFSIAAGSSGGRGPVALC
jgi:hypothetical protein